ncbi:MULTISPECIES: peptidoglycan D,D-transpeptidase FtsI family protein [Bacillus cereus group]|uniref:serine-type D-Ala-D-Ala carboxypeptidase n=1 Tax=Bacillus cereus TaxID=1396 RepID=A0AA44Q6I5_BACCE|nr:MULTISPECIES: penicillin-binding protein 2 [Bacillus cereus group]PFN07235.1 penicillin-binding protein [Bacillus cereus]PFO83337.1 penicillin-binding protein [Bacillus cereus]PFR90271.1 penicillin-binding protein [Bacillus cereus]
MVREERKMKKKESKRKKKTHIPFRLNVLFFFVFLMFSTVIIQLGKVQIIDGETYKNEVEKKEEKTVSTPVPRGKIFDREGHAVVDNKSLRTITYTKMKGVTGEEILHTAKQLAGMIEMPQESMDKLTEVDKKDFWMQLNKKRAIAKVTKEDEQKLRAKKLEGKDFDKKVEELRRERITAEELKELTPKDMKVLAIKSKMSAGYNMIPKVIKKDVNLKEYAVVSERLANLPGVDTAVDWEREYPYGKILRSVLGNVSSADEGLPKEQLDYYLVREYNRNDRVGKSYIEKQYEDTLHGIKEQSKNITDKEGNIIHTEQVVKGKSGNNLMLSIDMELQKRVDESIERNLMAFKASEPMMDRAFVVMMNPKTGELLSISGKKLVNKDRNMQVEDYALGTMTSSYELGSTVKGATLLTGYQTGAIQLGTRFVDAPMTFKGTKPKKSWKDFGDIDDLRALQVSSNVYMFNTALQIAGVNYVPDSPLNIKQEAFNKMRYHFGQFGLGVPTGIDLPNETVGQMGRKDHIPGFLLDYSIGQYDTYTPLQLAQYISTIANGGYRMKPQIVQEIREQSNKEGETGKVVQSMEPVILNRIDMDISYINQVKEGLKKVFQETDGTGVAHFQNLPYKPAGKTGTAETVYGGDSDVGKDGKGNRKKCYNLTLAGYAPYDAEPEVAFSVVVPWVNNDQAGINSKIGREILDAYFDLKVKKFGGNPVPVVQPSKPK